MRSLGLVATFCLLASSLPAPAQQMLFTNLPSTILNVGFEKPSLVYGAMPGTEPKSWFYFSSIGERRGGIVDKQRKSGLQSLLFLPLPGTTNYQGVAQRFRALPGYHYTFAANGLIDPQDPLVGDSYAQVSLEWQDAGGVELYRTYGASWNKDTPPGRWRRVMVEGDTPTNTAIGLAVITVFSKDERGIGSIYVDECELTSRRAGEP